MDHRQRRRSTPLRIRRWRSAAVGAALIVATGSVVAVTATGALTPRSSRNVVITTRSNSTYGSILVSGTTLYTLKANSTSCGATCLKYWPPVVIARGATAVAGHGVNATELGSVALKSGARQVTYAGRALFRFSLDKGPGQVKGEVTDTWGKWSVVVVRPHTSGSGGTPTTTPSTTTVPKGTTTTEPKATTTTQPSSGGGGGGGGVAF